MKKSILYSLLVILILCLAAFGFIGYRKQQRTREVLINKVYFLLTDVSKKLDIIETEEELSFLVCRDLTRLDTVCNIYEEETRGAFHYYKPGMFGKIADDIYANEYTQNELMMMKSDMQRMVQELSDHSGIAENSDLSYEELNNIFDSFYDCWGE